MRDCMQFDDAIRKYAICRYTICALGMQEMRQSARAINVWISHQWMALQSVSSLQSHSSLFPALPLLFSSYIC